jgi:hypothetical protein
MHTNDMAVDAVQYHFGKKAVVGTLPADLAAQRVNSIAKMEKAFVTGTHSWKRAFMHKTVQQPAPKPQAICTSLKYGIPCP